MRALENTITSYRQWRKTVMLVTLLDIFFVLLMIVLFTATFIASFTSTKATLALAALKFYLQSLSLGLHRISGIDTELERRKMEELINNVKTSCDGNVISKDLELQAILAATYEQICLASLNKNDE